jgi:tripeptidyl-peptidase-1
VFFSPGGFSDMFPRPAYQEYAASKYVKKIRDKNAGFFNHTGRGFPDVAAQAKNFRAID